MRCWGDTKMIDGAAQLSDIPPSMWSVGREATEESYEIVDTNLRLYMDATGFLNLACAPSRCVSTPAHLLVHAHMVC